MKIIDYRLTPFENNFSEIGNKKNLLKEQIISTSRYTNMKSAVTEHSDYNHLFQEVYNFKCSYCGINVECIGENNFEVDHILCESYCLSENIPPNDVQNLAFSCRECNRYKSGYVLKGDYFDLMSPDKNINLLFKRNSDFGIHINEDFSKDEIIRKYYEQLRFHYNTRRLDYLILMLNEFIKSNSKLQKNKDLIYIKDRLTLLRNKFFKRLEK